MRKLYALPCAALMAAGMAAAPAAAAMPDPYDATCHSVTVNVLIFEYTYERCTTEENDDGSTTT